MMNKPKLLNCMTILVFVVFFLSGCTSPQQDSGEKQYFLGYWTGVLNEGTASELNISYEFYQNDTYLYQIGPQQALGSWKLENDQLILTIAENSEPFNYTFSNDYRQVTLSPVKFDFSYTLTKQNK